MIPISDNVRCWNKPIINYWLIGINIAVFLWELKLEFSDELGDFVNTWGIIPAQISGAITSAISLNFAAWVVVVWRIFSLFLGMFLHGSFSQILGNLLFLCVFGKTLENILGHRCYLGFYLAAGVVTGMAQFLAEPSLRVPLIGANGAIAAVLGAYIIKFPQAKIYSVLPLIILYIPLEVPAFIYIFWWFIQQVFYGIGSLNIPPVGVNQSGVIYWGQVVGFLFGASFIRFRTFVR